ncbi:hypothetical protein ACOKFD_12555 [Flagellimonas sp. S174]|uniref:hypothetical protein n=1 Tax=Flagellimonas sp. S174 TaxID=3410790 RepID=UPI003BF5475C
MKITYKDKIVAFIDVLGFSELVLSKTNDRLNTFFDIITSDFKDRTVKNKLKYVIISDSIVVSIDNTKENLITICRILNYTQTQLFENGILLRGGISFGDFYMNKTKNIVVGPAMIKAYHLEQKAIYPRIILDRNFIPKYFNGTEDLRETKPLTLRYTPPSPYLTDYVYLNYMSGLNYYGDKNSHRKIFEFFKQSYYKNEFINKLEWIKKHLITEFQHEIEYFEEEERLSQRDQECYDNAKWGLSELNKL